MKHFLINNYLFATIANDQHYRLTCTNLHIDENFIDVLYEL